MTVQSKLDELINWYEKNNPEAGQRISVHAGPDTIKKFTHSPQASDGTFSYRGRTIVPLRKKQSRGPSH